MFGYRILGGGKAPNPPVTFAYLVVAGGGKGAGHDSGGGGGGGFRTSFPGGTGITVDSGSYTVTVGAGGASTRGGDSNFLDGFPSEFSSGGGGAGMPSGAATGAPNPSGHPGGSGGGAAGAKGGPKIANSARGGAKCQKRGVQT